VNDTTAAVTKPRKHETQKAQMLRVQSPLSNELELLVTKTIGCCVAVHKELGPGLLEAVYARAVRIELGLSGVEFESERIVPITYRGVYLCNPRLDLIVREQIVLELKSVDRLGPVHRAQVVSYLRTTGLRIGLLVNFNVPVIQEGLRRVIL
jgi:GxxExxY protein